MHKVSRIIYGRETQTRLSAFFCLRQKSIVLLMTLVISNTLCLSGSSAYATSKAENKPAIRLTSVSIKSIDWNNGTARTELGISIDNPGPAFKLKDLSYRLKLNDKPAAIGKHEKEIEVPAHSSGKFDLPCSVDLSSLPGVFWSVIAGGFEVHYELETEFTVPLFSLLTPRVKRSITGDLSLSQTVSGWTARIKESLAEK